MPWNPVGDDLEARFFQGKVWIKNEGSVGDGRALRAATIARLDALFPTTTAERRQPQAVRRHSWSKGKSAAREGNGEVCIHCEMVRVSDHHRPEGGVAARRCWQYYRVAPEHDLTPVSAGRLLARLPKTGPTPDCVGPAPKPRPRKRHYNYPALLDHWQTRRQENDSATIQLHAVHGRGRNCQGVEGGRSRPVPPPIPPDPFEEVDAQADRVLAAAEAAAGAQPPPADPPAPAASGDSAPPKRPAPSPESPKPRRAPEGDSGRPPGRKDAPRKSKNRDKASKSSPAPRGTP